MVHRNAALSELGRCGWLASVVNQGRSLRYAAERFPVSVYNGGPLGGPVRAPNGREMATGPHTRKREIVTPKSCSGKDQSRLLIAGRRRSRPETLRGSGQIADLSYAYTGGGAANHGRRNHHAADERDEKD